MASHVIEIARQEGAKFRFVCLALEDGGAIKMDAQDIGPNVTRIWGDKRSAVFSMLARTHVGPRIVRLKSLSISGSRTSVLQVWRSYGR